jgi:hypothetical protein
MHLFGPVTGHTAHVGFLSVNISLPAFAQVFVAHPTAVTGDALVEQIGTSLELVTVDKPTADSIRSADMTAAAAGVALAAMAFDAHLDDLVLIGVRTPFQNRGKRG